MKINKLRIEKFRHLEDIEFSFGKSITIIAGGNGTGKTSLLGMIGHLFTYGTEPKNLIGERFENKFSKVFKFSPEKDIQHKYKYFGQFSDGSEKPAESRQAKEGNKIRFRIDVGGRVRFGGKIKKPVVYLSLKRLTPIAGEKTIAFGKVVLNQDLIVEFNTIYNNIFSSEEVIKPVHMKSVNKKSFSPTTDKFDAFGISAGQDNIGHIILAILSFKALKKKDPNYDGGILLIDELDATLYPAAQKNLLIIFDNYAKELALQVIFTTHSSDILNFILSKKASKLKHNTQFVGLSNTLGKVKVKEGFIELEKILAELNHDALRTLKPNDINFYFEDREALLFYKAIIEDEEIGCEPDFKDLSLSCGVYKQLIDKKFEEFFRSVIVLDGDFKDQLGEENENTIVFLPGVERPENVIDKFLSNLAIDDPLWTNENQYTKQTYLQSKHGIKDDRDDMKKWFNEQIEFWGENGTRVFKRWKELNNEKAFQIVSRTRSVSKRITENYFELSHK